AVDGVNELLTWMAGDPDIVASESAAEGSAGSVLVTWPDGAWLVELPDGGHVVTPASPDTPADAVVRGTPFDLDRRFWGRPGEVEVSGSDDVLHRLRCRIAQATQ